MRILEWRDAYKQAVDIIRSSGYNGVLVVDGSAYAQNPDCKLSSQIYRKSSILIITFFYKRYHQVWSILGKC